MPNSQNHLKRNATPHTRLANARIADAAYSTDTAKVSKRVKAIHVSEVTAMRYLCVGCKRIFTHYPQGVDRNGCSVRMGALMSLTWALGLSHRSVAHPLSALECPSFWMSGWRAVQEAGRAAARGMSGRTLVIGADETIVKVRGKAMLAGFMADAERGELLGIDI